jgi:hypothetical protein
MSIGGVSGNNSVYDHHALEENAREGDEISSSPLDELGAGASILLLEGDIAAQVAALTIMSAQKQRETNREVQVAEEAALERSEALQVEAMHQEADDIRMAGILDGAAGAGSGAFTMAGGVTGVTAGERDQYAGAAKISDACGKAFGGMSRADQADDKANAATHEHEAGHHRRNLDAARDAIREGQDLLEHALDFYKQSQEAESDATNSSIRRG